MVNKKLTVCLIVDNPLRDLDGLILVAYYLSQKNVVVYLVPMYVQATDVLAIKPDLVLLNYLRPNNLYLAQQYKSKGISIGVLDTEGFFGNEPDEFAKLITSVGNIGFVDLYCCWGLAQYKALLKTKKFKKTTLKLTGCPRYDFCNTVLRSSLSKISNIGKFVLINANFPTINPLFSKGSDSEKGTMVEAGFDPDFADQYINDARIAFTSMIKLVKNISTKFKNVNFVLRPHPFENMNGYSQLKHIKNVFLKQEKTSIEWINSAICLIHLNCSTAVEAAMLGKQSISPAWLNTPILNEPNSNSLSFHAKNEKSFVQMLECLINGGQLEGYNEIKKSKAKIIENFYGKNEEFSAKSVSEEIIKLSKNKKKTTYNMSKYSHISKAGFLFYLKKLLGYNLYAFIKNIVRNKKIIESQEYKYFTDKYVKDKIIYINNILNNKNIKVESIKRSNFRRGGSINKMSVKVYID